MFMSNPLDPVREFDKTPRNREQQQREYDKDEIHLPILLEHSEQDAFYG